MLASNLLQCHNRQLWLLPKPTAIVDVSSRSVSTIATLLPVNSLQLAMSIWMTDAEDAGYKRFEIICRADFDTGKVLGELLQNLD